MIPKIIWQTYKTKLPPNDSLEPIKSWTNKNPGFSWNYFDDEKCESFISENFPQEFVNMYRSLPYGVMKADAWRIAIIYIYGGVYADLDTVCLVPIEEWIKDYSFVAAIETPIGAIGNFTFAAEPKHPIIKSCLDQLLLNYNDENYLKKIPENITPIQNYGAAAFHSGITNYLKNQNNMDRIKIYDFHDNAFTPFPSHKTFVHHLVASISWKNDYNSWREQEKKDFNIGEEEKTLEEKLELIRQAMQR
jgi:mannosyltransferase OCH1-like enzyme